ncbi:MAG TPA: exopolysaccharide biosynthesis polyprenyl glycosylphosphotransferase [Candidatus Dormibacteraeota bacterium]|nr:exopolysaccharide biosynthesis polyprenyl glycosylphosphotransferase [Candidatus Dormibacteraeota bacterium]
MSELAANIPLAEGRGPRQVSRRRRSVGSSQRKPNSVLVSEETFLHMLCLERKRAERSRKPFLLLLLETGKLVEGPRNKEILSKIVSALSASMRDTDIRGWYEENAVLGVIFSEISTNKGEARNAILTKVIAALRSRLEPKQFHQIHLSYEVFPEDWDQENPWQASDSKVYPDLIDHSVAHKLPRVIKRTVDILGSLVALILLSPLFLLIAAVIKLTSQGPVFFRQERIGRYGTPFTFLKFRSMHATSNDQIHKEYVKRFIAGQVVASESEQGQKIVYKITQDPRITWVGRILRGMSFDEIPQFLNVLRGEMSLVGPRPPVAYEVESYDIWHRRRILEAKPGITGLWQVSGRSQTSFDDMVRLDLQYVRKWSLWLDIKILLQTPTAVFSGKGAY